MCRNRKQPSSRSPQPLTAGQMGGCQSPGFELLWHSSSCPPPPATAPTASRSPVPSFKVLAVLLTEQPLKDECPCLPGSSKIAQTLFSPPTPGICWLEGRPCRADGLRPSQGPQRLQVSGESSKETHFSTHWQDLHIDGEGEADGVPHLKSCACFVTYGYNFIDLFNFIGTSSYDQASLIIDVHPFIISHTLFLNGAQAGLQWTHPGQLASLSKCTSNCIGHTSPISLNMRAHLD